MPTIKLRRGTAAEWTAANPILEEGEIGYEKDTQRYKIGDGALRWTVLNYFVPQSDLPGIIQPIVTTTVAQSSTVTNAAAAAVSGQLTGYDVVKGGDERVPQKAADETGYVYAIIDQNNRMAFGIKSDGTIIGKFTASISDGTLTLTKFVPEVQARMDQLVTLADEAKYVYTITDANGRSAFGIRQDGIIEGTITKALALAVPPAPVPADYLIETVTDGASNRQLFRVKRDGGKRAALTTTGDNFSPVLTVEGKVLFRQTLAGVTRDFVTDVLGGSIYPAASRLDNVRCFGDSLTSGVGGSGGGFVGRLATLLGTIPTSNYGLGGQLTDQIASRQGGKAATLLSAITIPATTTSVALQVAVDMLFQSNNPALTATAVINGVTGTLSRAAGAFSTTSSYTFTRTTAGTATACLVGTPIIHQAAIDSESSVQVFFPGRNDLTQTGSLDSVNPAVDAMVGYMKPYAKKYLVMGVTGATSEPSGSAKYNTLIAQNNAAAAKYGDSFIDINRYLISNALTIMSANGITPTAQDTTDLANDIIPTSLHAAGDAVHFTNVTYQAIAQAVYDRIVAKGWLL